eukprot:1673822-Heterocapsa_arctica.AAC.1
MLLPHPADAQPGPAQDEAVVYWSKDQLPPGEAFQGHAFLDGSCIKQPCTTELSGASWAIAKIDDMCNLVAYMHGPVWATLPQTSPAAEHAAFGVLCQFISHPTTAMVDYSGICSGFSNGFVSQLSAKKSFAG